MLDANKLDNILFYLKILSLDLQQWAIESEQNIDEDDVETEPLKI